MPAAKGTTDLRGATKRESSTRKLITTNDSRNAVTNAPRGVWYLIVHGTLEAFSGPLSGTLIPDHDEKGGSRVTNRSKGALLYRKKAVGLVDPDQG
jgi:hypothetical protein